MATTNPSAQERAGTTTVPTDDYALPCLDLAHEYAGDALLIDFGAWCTARRCTAATLQRQVEAI